MRVTNVAQRVLNNVVSKMLILLGIQGFNNSQDAVIEATFRSGTVKKSFGLLLLMLSMIGYVPNCFAQPTVLGSQVVNGQYQCFSIGTSCSIRACRSIRS